MRSSVNKWLALVLAVVLACAALQVGPSFGFSRSVEREELPPPVVLPDNVPAQTTSVLRAGIAVDNPAIRSLKLQYRSPSGRWRTAGIFRDDGKSPDVQAGDHQYALEVRRRFSTVGPLLVRASARLKGLGGRVVSPAIQLNVIDGRFIRLSGVTMPIEQGFESSQLADASGFTLTSSDTLAILRNGGVDTAPDISVRVSAKTSDTALTDFIADYQGGWFSTYAEKNSQVFSGHPTIVVSDLGVVVGHAPVIAYFVELTPTTVVVLTLNQFESDRTAALRSAAETMLSGMVQ